MRGWRDSTLFWAAYGGSAEDRPINLNPAKSLVLYKSTSNRLVQNAAI